MEFLFLNILLWLTFSSHRADAEQKIMQGHGGATRVLGAPNEAAQYLMRAYVSACNAEVGIPPPFSCTMGQRRSRRVTFYTRNSEAFQELYTPDRHKYCDEPDFAGLTTCNDRNYIGRLNVRNRPEAEWVFICRNFSGEETKSKASQVVAIIGYNSQTGASCFFDGRAEIPDNALIDLTKQESQDKFKVLSELKDTGEQCMSCHTSYPWIVTPHVVNHVGNSGRILPVRKSKGKYWAVSKQFFLDQSLWEPKFLKVPEEPSKGGACSQCHRIIGSTTLGPVLIGTSACLPFQEKTNWDQFAQSFANITPAFHYNVTPKRGALTRFPECAWHFQYQKLNFPMDAPLQSWLQSDFWKSAAYIRSCLVDIKRNQPKDPDCSLVSQDIK